MKTAGRIALLIAALLATADFALAQKPKVTNAKVQELSAASGLKPAVDGILEKQTGPLWIAYRIPAKAKERSICCWDSWNEHHASGECCLGCRLESSKDSSFSGTSSDCAPPEPLSYVFLLLRAENRQIQKVRVFSADCPLDFAGLPLFWLEEVRPEQSVEFLAAYAALPGQDDKESYYREPLRQSVMAIAMHDSPAADQALEKLIQPGQPLRLRENVAFWLGVERGQKGVELLRKYAKNDPDDSMRRKATFAFSQSKEPGALQDLIDMARKDPAPEVRSQAIFWLAQVGGRKAAGEITDAIENDPETAVKKKAVFALSQLHDGSGVPLLINVARTNKNPAVRKQAFFWLGQSHDPRALDFLEEVLTK